MSFAWILLGKSSPKEPSKAKDLSRFRKDGKELASFYEKDKTLPYETGTNSFDISGDISLLSSELDDFSLNTSINLSDETDPLKSY